MRFIELNASDVFVATLHEQEKFSAAGHAARDNTAPVMTVAKLLDCSSRLIQGHMRTLKSDSGLTRSGTLTRRFVPYLKRTENGPVLQHRRHC